MAIRKGSSADVTLPGDTNTVTIALNRGPPIPCAFSGLLDHGQGCTRSGAVTLERTLCELKQEGLLPSTTARRPAFADGYHLSQNGLIRRFAMTPARTTNRIAALAFSIACCHWRLAITNAIILVIRWTVFPVHSSVPRGHRKLPGSPVKRRIS